MVEEAMFPGYLFIELDASGTGQSWAPIRSTFGVSKLVSFGGQPAKVDTRLITQLQRHEQSRFETPTHLFNQGEKVMVVEGPFAGLEAIYQMDNAEQRCMVLLNMLSKQVPLQVDANNLRKVS
jgi:transcriptional antiterminator RfaH